MTKQKICAGWMAIILAVLCLLSACGGEEDPRAAQAHEKDPVIISEPEGTPDPAPSVSIYAATGLDNPNVRKNGYLAQRFHRVGEFMIYTGVGAASHIGIDVSSHQKEIDWQQVAETGVEFAMIRVGYRGYETGDLNPDPCFTANIEGALASGLRVGIYFFSQAVNTEEAAAEAARVLEWIAPYNVSYPVVFDWEPVWEETARTKNVDDETVTECAEVFCGAVKEAGYIPAVYFNKNQGYGVMDLARLSAYDFWLAEYTEVPEFRYHFEMWQYSCTGTIPGIGVPVDLNLCLTDYPEGGGEKS